ncbi:MAG: AraC family transcriptional regulator [Clostridiales bacterium]|nr:AraC family transcriptional regulator [Clostridiales bacterium]
MMLYSELNITQISEVLGFQSIHYFSRLFKKIVGIAPTEYISRVKDNRPINVLHNANTPKGEFEIPLRDFPG